MQYKKTGNIWIQVGGELPLLADVSAFVRRNNCGAVNIFQGVTRNHDRGKKVTMLTYDSYDEMARSQSETILKNIQNKYPVEAAAIFHKTGDVPVGDVSMIVAVSTPHREDSSNAVLSIIRQIKQDVPIWKKEIYDEYNNKSEWKGEV